MRLFMNLYPLVATWMAAAAVFYMLTMGHVRADPLILAALTGGLMAVPVSAVMAKSRV